MSIVDRIRQLSKDKGLSLTVLEQNLGFGNGSIGKWNKQSPSCARISLVADYLGTSVDYLISGKEKNSSTELTADEQELLTYFNELDTFNKGKIIGKAETLAELNTKTVKSEPKNITKTVLKQPKTGALIEPDQINEDTYTYIDLYDMPASAGNGTYLMSNSCEPLKVKCNSLTSDANFAVEVRGESMEPSFYDGDVILIKTQPFVELGELGIFIINDEGYVKEFGGDRLISLNSKYKDIYFHEYDDIHCKGKVLGVLENDDILE